MAARAQPRETATGSGGGQDARGASEPRHRSTEDEHPGERREKAGIALLQHDALHADEEADDQGEEGPAHCGQPVAPRRPDGVRRLLCRLGGDQRLHGHRVRVRQRALLDDRLPATRGLATGEQRRWWRGDRGQRERVAVRPPERLQHRGVVRVGGVGGRERHVQRFAVDPQLDRGPRRVPGCASTPRLVERQVEERTLVRQEAQADPVGDEVARDRRTKPAGDPRGRAERGRAAAGVGGGCRRRAVGGGHVGARRVGRARKTAAIRGDGVDSCPSQAGSCGSACRRDRAFGTRSRRRALGLASAERGPEWWGIRLTPSAARRARC